MTTIGIKLKKCVSTKTFVIIIPIYTNRIKQITTNTLMFQKNFLEERYFPAIPAIENIKFTVILFQVGESPLILFSTTIPGYIIIVSMLENIIMIGNGQRVFKVLINISVVSEQFSVGFFRKLLFPSNSCLLLASSSL